MMFYSILYWKIVHRAWPIVYIQKMLIKWWMNKCTNKTLKSGIWDYYISQRKRRNIAVVFKFVAWKCVVALLLLFFKHWKKWNNYQNNYPHSPEYYLHFLVRDFQIFVPQITFLPVILKDFKDSLCEKIFHLPYDFLGFHRQPCPSLAKCAAGISDSYKTVGKVALLIPMPKVESMEG